MSVYKTCTVVDCYHDCYYDWTHDCYHDWYHEWYSLCIFCTFANSRSNCTLMCVIPMSIVSSRWNKETEKFSRYWLDECRKNRELQENFKSVITMVLEQANQVKDDVSARECKAMLTSLRYERYPMPMLSRLPVIPHEINLNLPEKSARTKYFKGIMSDGNPVW